MCKYSNLQQKMKSALLHVFSRIPVPNWFRAFYWKSRERETWNIHAKTKEKKKNVESILIHCRMNLDKYKWSKYSIFVIIPREHAIVYSTRSVTAWKRLFPIANKLIVMQYYNNLAAGLVNKLNIKDWRSN